MKIVKTAAMEETLKLPTELDQLEIKMARDFTQMEKDHYKMSLLKKGVMGEEKFIQLLKDFGNDHWLVMRNLWIKINNQNPYEYDIVLFTNHCIYIFEVKNYTGKFIYQNGACIENDRKMDFDIIQQARRNVVRMQRIFEHLPTPPMVKGALVFIGEHNQVEIKSAVEDIEILTLTDLYAYIKEIVREENAYSLQPQNSAQLIEHLENFEVTHPYPPKPLLKSTALKMRRGIRCANCGSFDIKHSKHYVQCPCGYHESREEAVVRTTCEYGVLCYDENFSLGEIMTFIDYQASKTFVRDTLSKHFKRILNSRFTSYEFKKLPYYLIHHQFTFKFPAILYTKDKNPKVIVFDQYNSYKK
jgi:hypothetical protein